MRNRYADGPVVSFRTRTRHTAVSPGAAVTTGSSRSIFKKTSSEEYWDHERRNRELGARLCQDQLRIERVGRRSRLEDGDDEVLRGIECEERVVAVRIGGDRLDRRAGRTREVGRAIQAHGRSGVGLVAVRGCI